MESSSLAQLSGPALSYSHSHKAVFRDSFLKITLCTRATPPRPPLILADLFCQITYISYPKPFPRILVFLDQDHLLNHPFQPKQTLLKLWVSASLRPRCSHYPAPITEPTTSPLVLDPRHMLSRLTDPSPNHQLQNMPPPAPTFGTSTAPFSPPGDATCKAAAKAADYDLKVKKMITIRSLKAAQGSHMLLCSQPIYWTTTKTSSSLPCAGGDRYSPTHLVNHPCTHSSAVQKLRRGRAQQDLCRRPATTRSSTTTVYQQRHSWAAIQALRRGVEKYPTELFRVCRAFLAALPSAREKQ